MAAVGIAQVEHVGTDNTHGAFSAQLRGHEGVEDPPQEVTVPKNAAMINA